MKKVKNLFKEFSKEKLIILLCAIMSVITLFVSVIIFVSAESEVENKDVTHQTKPEKSEELESYPTDSPKSLDFQSIDGKTCIVASIGGFSGTDLEIPQKSPSGETVVGIGSRAFEGCDELETVHIPATVTSIGDSVFKGCSSLIEITVDRANTKFSSSGGILYSKSKNVLICYPSLRADSTYLLNPGVKSICDDAFHGVKKLTGIYYEGTIEEFSQISVGEGNRILYSLPITCNYSPAK